MTAKIKPYNGAATGWGAVRAVVNSIRHNMDAQYGLIALFHMNKVDGFDCPGCAWPDPKHTSSFDVCEMVRKLFPGRQQKNERMLNSLKPIP